MDGEVILQPGERTCKKGTGVAGHVLKCGVCRGGWVHANGVLFDGIVRDDSGKVGRGHMKDQVDSVLGMIGRQDGFNNRGMRVLLVTREGPDLAQVPEVAKSTARCDVLGLIFSALTCVRVEREREGAGWRRLEKIAKNAR